MASEHRGALVTYNEDHGGKQRRAHSACNGARAFANKQDEVKQAVREDGHRDDLPQRNVDPRKLGPKTDEISKYAQEATHDLFAHCHTLRRASISPMMAPVEQWRGTDRKARTKAVPTPLFKT